MPTFTANDLATLKIGDTKEYSDGCYPCIQGSQAGGGQDVATNGPNKVYWPNTNEFSWGGLGSSCSMNPDPFKYGYGYGTGGVCGQRAIVKRTSYNGNQVNCCTSGNLLDGENTCDPQYSNVALGNCDSVLAVYCSDPNNISKSKCQDFISKRGASKLSPNAIQNYCAQGDNIISNFCQSQPKGTWTDNAVAAYCKKYPNNQSFCGCYNLDATYIAIQNQLEKKGISMFPHCNAKTCAANNLAYISSNVQPCPSQDICLQSIDIGSVGNTNSISGVNFNCTQTQIQNQQQAQTTPNQTPIEPGLSWSAIFLLIGIIFGMIIFIFFILKLLVGKSNTNTDTSLN
jgi:hypothetical protein